MNKQDSNNPGKRGNLYFFMMDLIKKSRPFGRLEIFKILNLYFASGLFSLRVRDPEETGQRLVDEEGHA